MRRPAVLAVLAMAALSPALTADTLSLSFMEHAAANVFQTRDPERDRISALDFTLTKDLSSITLIAGASADHFAWNPGLSFAGLNGGLDYLRPLGKRSGLYLSLTASATLFREDFRDFNNVAIEARGALKAYAGSSSIFRAGYAMEYRSYGNALFDFLSQELTASLDKFLPTNTTLKAGAGWGHKYFLHPFPAPEPSPEPAVSGAQSGYGGPRARGPRGGGYFLDPGARSGGAGIHSLSLSGLVAQGLGTRVGISLAGSRQWIVSGKSPFSSSEEFYLAENPTFDTFSWDGGSLAGALTVHGPWDTELKMVYTVSEKTFPGIESMDLDGTALGTTRLDRRRQLEVRFEKPLRRLTLFLTYALIDNRSNDPLFTWKGPFAAAGIRWDLAFGGPK